MSRKSKTSPHKQTIYAYGFEASSFEFPAEPVTVGDFAEIEFLGTNDSRSLDSVDGVIIPQGIFEVIETGYHSKVTVQTTILQDRLKQVFNLLKDNKWVCFLVGAIIDKIRQSGSYQDISNTDLCKKMLNLIGIQKDSRLRVDGLPVHANYDEFKTYMRVYGIANTVFNLPYSVRARAKVIAGSETDASALEVGTKLFFLPFHTAKRDYKTTKSVATEVTKSVLDYRRKRLIDTPDWAKNLKFKKEEELESHLVQLLSETSEIENELESLRRFKIILTTSGDILRDKVIEILKVFFGLNAVPVDENIEDGKILDEKGNPLALIEAKGTKGGIKREFINQVDSHRERNELPPSLPGVLIINNEMAVSGIDKRLNTNVPKDQVKHARNLNVLIIRTIDLLFLIKHFEELPPQDRSDRVLELVNAGGGWLEATSANYRIVNG